MYEIAVSDSEASFVVKFAVNADRLLLRASCSCAAGNEGLPCEHIENAIYDGPPGDLTAEEFDAASEESQKELEKTETDFEAAENAIQEIGGVEDIESYIRDLAVAISDLSGSERGMEKARQIQDKEDRQYELELARDCRKEAKDSIRESKKELSDYCRNLVRLFNGVSTSGRAKKSGWANCDEWTQRTKEELSAITDKFTAQQLELANAKAEEFDAQEAKYNVRPKDSAGGCLSAAVVLIASLLLA